MAVEKKYEVDGPKVGEAARTCSKARHWSYTRFFEARRFGCRSPPARCSLGADQVAAYTTSQRP